MTLFMLFLIGNKPFILLEIYEHASGAKVNLQKPQEFLMGKLWYEKDTPLDIRWTKKSNNCFYFGKGVGRSSEVERSLMVRWVVGSILHWCNKGRGICYPVCGMVHIKEPLLLIDKCSLCGGSGFPFSLSEWSLTICLTPYNRR